MKKSFHLDLRKYDLTITTSFLYKHGISGHVYEEIEYYWLVKNNTSLNPCILLSDGTTKEEFTRAVNSKYIAVDDIMDHVYEHHKPRLLFTNNLLVVDGSWRGMNECQIFADNVFIFRCAEDNFDYFYSTFNNVYLLQDFAVYGDAEGINYNKKILFSNIKVPPPGPTNTAMFYMTSTCRAMTQGQIDEIAKDYDDYVVLTNTPEKYNNSYEVPVDNLWELFDTYVYTPIPRQWDCSSRFIKECEYFGRKVDYRIDYYDRALRVRRNNSLEQVEMKPDDYFVDLINDKCKQYIS